MPGSTWLGWRVMLEVRSDTVKGLIAASSSTRSTKSSATTAGHYYQTALSCLSGTSVESASLCCCCSPGAPKVATLGFLLGFCMFATSVSCLRHESGSSGGGSSCHSSKSAECSWCCWPSVRLTGSPCRGSTAPCSSYRHLMKTLGRTNLYRC